MRRPPRGPGRARRGLELALLVVGLGPGPGAAQERTSQEAFEQANALYLRGDLAGAEALYRRVLARLPGSVAARYNLGNALYRQDRAGAALQQYLGALRRAPRDALARRNATAARRRLAADLPPDDRAAIAGPPPAPLGWLSPDEAGWATLAAFYLAASLAVLARVRPAARAVAASGAALILVVAAAFHVAAARARAVRPEALVVSARALARAGPSSERPVVLTLPEGAPLRVGEERGGWAFVSLPNGLSGWVPREEIGFIP
jgi:tetratricopeptide (TPR) repeat protein